MKPLEQEKLPETLSTVPQALQELFQGRGPNELNDILIQAKAALMRKSFWAFISEFINDVMTEKVIYNWHMQYLADELQSMALDVANRRPKKDDLVINICPGMSKTTICTILFPVWCWVLDPTISFITATHSEEIAGRQSNKSRDLIKSEHFRKYFPELKINNTQDNKGDYENTFGGYRIATSSKKAITGRHCLISICDDIQNSEDANSEIVRNQINTWYSESLMTRKANKAVSVSIIVQQRLHPFDITGFLLDRGHKIKQITLPAQLSDKVMPMHLKEFYVNGFLDSNPTRLSQDIIDDQIMLLGRRAFECQFNQNPQSEGASIIKEEWFNTISVSEWEKLRSSQHHVIEFFVDTAYGAKSNRDATAILAVTKIGERMYITNLSTVRLETPELLRHLQRWTFEAGGTGSSKLWIESRANGQTIYQLLKDTSGLNVKEFPYQKDGKVTRLHAISPIVECGRVVLVQDKWNRKFLDEVCLSSAKHDDITDVMIMAIENLLVRPKKQGYNFGVGFY